MTVATLESIRTGMIVLGIVVAAGSVALVSEGRPSSTILKVLLLFWSLGPPCWFLFEYQEYRKLDVEKSVLEEVRTKQELAAGFWVGVGGLVIGLLSL